MKQFTIQFSHFTEVEADSKEQIINEIIPNYLKNNRCIELKDMEMEVEEAYDAVVDDYTC